MNGNSVDEPDGRTLLYVIYKRRIVDARKALSICDLSSLFVLISGAII